jgi:iron(III) transport system permease protein
LPGTILAVGIFIPVAFLDNAINGLAMKLFETGTGPLLQGTLLVMVTAYVVRFMAAGFNSIDNAMQRITKSIDEAARGMGLKGLNMLRRIHLPILRAGVLTAVTMVFIDVMKEMPITLMTRPFGWDTLAVKIYELTSEGEWERAALPAITLIMAGLIPIILLVKHSEKEL